jgi:hypothetical protein
MLGKTEKFEVVQQLKRTRRPMLVEVPGGDATVYLEVHHADYAPGDAAYLRLQLSPKAARGLVRQLKRAATAAAKIQASLNRYSHEQRVKGRKVHMRGGCSTATGRQRTTRVSPKWENVTCKMCLRKR